MNQRKQRPKLGDPVQPGDSQRVIAVKIGMSRRQQWQARKIASIPEDEFEKVVDSDNPPTVTALLDMAHQRATPTKVCPHCGGAQ